MWPICLLLKNLTGLISCHVIEGMDKDRQKERLANIMAFGEDIDPKKKKQMAKTSPPVYEEPDVDRFDECEFLKKKSLCAVYYNQSCILRERNASYFYICH